MKTSYILENDAKTQIRYSYEEMLRINGIFKPINAGLNGQARVINFIKDSLSYHLICVGMYVGPIGEGWGSYQYEKTDGELTIKLSN